MGYPPWEMGRWEVPYQSPLVQKQNLMQPSKVDERAPWWRVVNGVFLSVFFSECFVILSTAVFAVGNFVAFPKQLCLRRNVSTTTTSSSSSSLRFFGTH